VDIEMGVHWPCTQASKVCVVLLYATAPAISFAHGICDQLSRLHDQRPGGACTNAVVPLMLLRQIGKSFGVETFSSNVKTAGSSSAAAAGIASFAHPAPSSTSAVSETATPKPNTPRNLANRRFI
jgi:hypothetical protein